MIATRLFRTCTRAPATSTRTASNLNCDGLDVPYAGPILGAGACGPENVVLETEAVWPAVRVFSAYEPLNPEEPLEVSIEVAQPTIVVLVSFEPVRWIVHETFPGSIEGILLDGVDAGDVTGPQGVFVELLEAVTWVSDWSGADADAIESRVLEVYGLDVASLHVCYTGSGFSVVETDEWVDVQPQVDCDELGDPIDEQPDLVAAAAACPDVFADAHVCLTAGTEGILLVGLESGTTCQYAPVGLPPMTTSLAWIGDDLFGCDQEQTMQHISLTEGTVQATLTTCGAVTAFQGGLFFLPPRGGDPDMPEGSMYLAHGLQHAECDVFDVYDVTTRNSRIATQGLTLYSSWHAIDRIEGTGIDGGEPGEIVLQDYNDWIMGISVTDDGLLVILGGLGDQRLLTFDSAGNLVSETAFDLAGYGGIVCLPTAPPD